MAAERISNLLDETLGPILHRTIREMGVDIHYKLKEGKVVLWGEVRDEGIKKGVVQIIREIDGIKGVIHRIRVAPATHSLEGGKVWIKALILNHR